MSDLDRLTVIFKIGSNKNYNSPKNLQCSKPFKRCSKRRPLGFSLVEILFALFLLTLLFQIGFMALKLFGGKASENLSKRLVLQMEARKGLLNMYRLLQEGIEVITPQPGTTLPFFVFKDYVNNLRMVYLVKDDAQSKIDGEEMFGVFTVCRDPNGKVVDKPKMIMKHVKKMVFTPYNYGGVLISGTLRGGRGEFSLVNYVRLQNKAAEEEL